MCTLLRKFINCFKKPTTPDNRITRKTAHTTGKQNGVAIAYEPIYCTPKLQHRKQYKFYCNRCSNLRITTYYFHAKHGICPICDRFTQRYPSTDYHEQISNHLNAIHGTGQDAGLVSIEEILEEQPEETPEEMEYDY